MGSTFPCSACGRLNRVRPDRAAEHPKCGHCLASLAVDGAPIHVDDDALERLIRSSPVPVLVDFYADWCGPCRQLAPHLEGLGKAHAGELIVVKVDTEKHQRNAQRLGVQGIPAVYLYKGGALVEQTSGMRPQPFWEQWTRPYLGG